MAAICILAYSSLNSPWIQTEGKAAVIQITVILSATVYFQKRSLQLHRGAVPALMLMVLSVFVILHIQAGLESRALTRLAGLGDCVSGDQGADQCAGRGRG